MKRISAMIIKILVAIAIKKIAEIVAASAVKNETEKAKNQLSQLLSLVGIPQDTLRLIKGLL
jgi:cbb3-type cytochrome oxidase cytochrome c subunit